LGIKTESPVKPLQYAYLNGLLGGIKKGAIFNGVLLTV